MKQIAIVLQILIFTGIRGQILLENTYDSAATHNFCASNYAQLINVNLEVSGERYILINKCGKNMKMFDIGHNILKTISLSHLPVPAATGNQMGSFLYLSEKLFNSDNKMEFMYCLVVPSFSTIIYNEDGVVLFSEPGYPSVMPNVHQVQYPIYNTSQGTKLILSYQDGKAKVFSLPGVLTTALQKNNSDILNSDSKSLSNAFPNPAINQTRIGYVLPNDAKEGEIVFFDPQGKEIKRFIVDSSTDFLSVSTSDLSSGVYFYRLEVNGLESGTKKIVVIK